MDTVNIGQTEIPWGSTQIPIWVAVACSLPTPTPHTIPLPLTESLRLSLQG